jgi:hypothetical protein
VSGPFATATEFCEFTGLNVPTDLARIQAHLEYASAVIRRFTGQTLSAVTADVVTLEGIDRPTLILPQRPVTAITSVVEDSITLAATDYTFTRSGLLKRESEADWTDGATVTYDHGYAETDDEFAALRAICIEAASRAYTLNERSASEAMGATLMESAGYSPEVFLTIGEKWLLSDFGKVVTG